MVWNKYKPDLLAAGYGNVSFAVKAGRYSCKPPHQAEGSTLGYLAIWSLHSPDWPLYWTELPAGVTSLDWSARVPSVLAVGLYDGSVRVYDVKSKSKEPMLVANHDNGQHTDPVW